MPDPATVRPSVTALPVNKVTSYFLELPDRDIHSCLWTSLGRAWTFLPAWSLSPLWVFHEKALFVRAQLTPPVCLWSLDPRRVHPVASTGLLVSWNITVLHSQIKVSSISLLRSVKLDLLPSWVEQPAVATVMTGCVLGSIQLGIFFPLFFGERGSQGKCLANFWNTYLYKRTIKVE